MSASKVRSEPKATDQYRIALNGLKCGDRSFAEQLVRRQVVRTRLGGEMIDLMDRLGFLSESAKVFFEIPDAQMMQADTNGDQPLSRLEICIANLRKAGIGGLKIGTLTTIIGEVEAPADFRDRAWRRPVVAEVDSYADRGILVRVGDKFYMPEYAPQSTVPLRFDPQAK